MPFSCFIRTAHRPDFEQTTQSVQTSAAENDGLVQFGVSDTRAVKYGLTQLIFICSLSVIDVDRTLKGLCGTSVFSLCLRAAFLNVSCCCSLARTGTCDQEIWKDEIVSLKVFIMT